MKLEILINPNNNCIREEKEKKFLIISDTMRSDIQAYLKSLTLKEYAPNFIITRDGNIHKLYNDKYYSNIMHDDIVNQHSIFIYLENAGELKEENGVYYNWCNDIIPKNEIYTQYISNTITYYHSYTKEQIIYLAYLVRYLCKIHNIEIKELINGYDSENRILLMKFIDVFSESPNISFDTTIFNKIIKE